jgi:hypothetical protein
MYSHYPSGSAHAVCHGDPRNRGLTSSAPPQAVAPPAGVGTMGPLPLVLGMREGQLWLEAVALAVAIVDGVFSSPAVVQTTPGQACMHVQQFARIPIP